MILSLLFLFSSLNLTDQWNNIGRLIIYSLIFLLMCMLVVFKKKIIKINDTMLFLFYLFLLSCSIGALLNSDVFVLLGALVFFSLYISTSVILPSLCNYNCNELVAKAILISHIPLIFIPLLTNGINSMPYQGIFYNPNSFGNITVTLFAVLVAIFLKNFEEYITLSKKQRFMKLKLLLQLIFMFGVFWLVILSGSRTSFLTGLVVLVIGLFFLTIFVIKTKKLKKLLLRGTSVSFVAVVIYAMLALYTNFNQYVYLNIIYKFKTKASNGDVLDHRGEIWRQTMKEAGLFGKGDKYFEQNIGLGAHNTFISILGQYGWVSLIIILLFLVLAVFYVCKYSVKNVDDKYKYLPFLLMVSFITLSMGEIMMFKLSMIATFCTIGVCSNFKTLKIRS